MMIRLKKTCNFKEAGCNLAIRLDCLEAHKIECIYNPNILIECEKGCELFYERQYVDVKAF
jgi:hypothetical protein